jgi:hypothetical protein
MSLDNHVILMNSNISEMSSLKEAIRSFNFIMELTTSDWYSTLTQNTIEGYNNNMEALIHYAKVTLKILEKSDEFERCKLLNYAIQLHEPLIKS